MHDLKTNKVLSGDVYNGQQDNSEYCEHYGMPKRSGRYPWGSGKEPFQHGGDFLSRVNELKSKGLSEKEIANSLGMTTTSLRMQTRVANHERKNLDADRARSLRADGKSNYEIAEIMGYKNESSIRSLLNEDSSKRRNAAVNTAEILKKELEEKGMIDIGAGAERLLNVSSGVLKEASFILETEGYHVYPIGVQQVNNKGKQTTVVVLARPEYEYKDAYQKMGKIEMIGEKYHSKDGGETFQTTKYPASLDSKRVGIRYAEDGGLERDGTIEIRRGCKDLDMGGSHYAQVRILVDGTHYLKGMALYSDNLPDGVDVMFNTNKKRGTDKFDVLKAIKDEDPNNPFGAYIPASGQSYYTDKNGKQQLSPINKLKAEGEWEKMSKKLSSQFLSKQDLELVRKQLNLTYKDNQDEFDEIMKLTNPTVKKKLLMDFADQCDGAAVHLKAAALPRQKVQVILPVPSLKDNEVYAPNYKNGEKVALVRFPHGGKFEIPILTVNNKHADARKMLGTDIQDAVGINSKTAERLSGADFDGDQVVVIPTNANVKIKNREPLAGLVGFDPKDSYGPSAYGNKNVKLMSKKQIGKQMGMASNLITDMTLKGASDEELERAVRHSMVVIDAYKHKLDYKQSEKDNGINALKMKYQAHINENGEISTGASTLLSRRKQTVQVDERKGSAQINPETGEVTYKTSGRTYVDKKTGKTVKAMTKVSLIENTKDVRTLSSGTDIENAYADYANKMKSLANEARKAYKATGNIQTNPEAKKVYANEVASLKAKLNVALMNAPKERRAQIIANSQIKEIMAANPDMEKDQIKKISQQRINDARIAVGASGKDTRIDITDREWSAIQAGAVTESVLSQVLRYADDKVVREKATPRQTSTLSTTKVNKMKAMQASGYTNAEIAEALGVSTSTVTKYTK